MVNSYTGELQLDTVLTNDERISLTDPKRSNSNMTSLDPNLNKYKMIKTNEIWK